MVKGKVFRGTLNKMMGDLVDLYNKDQEVSKFSEFSEYNLRYHADDDENDEYDADNAFSLASSDISQDVRLHIRALLRTGQNTALLNIFTTLFEDAFYFAFFHPNGIMLHDLVDHKQELLRIYSQASNSSSKREIRKRIDELTDMRNNSVNEKCSRTISTKECRQYFPPMNNTPIFQVL